MAEFINEAGLKGSVDAKAITNNTNYITAAKMRELLYDFCESLAFKNDVDNQNSLIAAASFGIKYSWADDVEKAAQIGMVADELGVQRDTGYVYKYSGSAWVYYFDLGYVNLATLDARYAQKHALSLYLRTAAAASTYLTIAAATATYLSQAAAATNYETKANANVWRWDSLFFLDYTTTTLKVNLSSPSGGEYINFSLKITTSTGAVFYRFVTNSEEFGGPNATLLYFDAITLGGGEAIVSVAYQPSWIKELVVTEFLQKNIASYTDIGTPASADKVPVYDISTNEWKYVLISELGGGGSYTDADAQDAVGAIATNSATVNLSYISETSLTASVNDSSITNAKLANAAAYSVKANATGSSASPQDIALAQNETIARLSGNVQSIGLQDWYVGTATLVAGTVDISNAVFTTASLALALTPSTTGTLTDQLKWTAYNGKITVTGGSNTDTVMFTYTIKS